jgi:hypothetical protein
MSEHTELERLGFLLLVAGLIFLIAWIKRKQRL